jgi:hypothetical protein
MRSASLTSWFEPKVEGDDFFVTPNFGLGQFFYSTQTARELVSALDHFRSPCCLCTPRLAAEWHARGRAVTLLEYDLRFANLPGFRQFDVLRPQPVREVHDLVIFDPIFVPAATLRRALDAVIAPERVGLTAVYMTFPVDRESELLAAFADHGLAPLNFELSYNNVKKSCDGLFRLYGNRPL